MIKILIGGIAVEHDHLNLQMLKRFQSALNQPDFADIGEDTMKMRMIKSSEEHELYRKTARIADMGGKYNSINSSKDLSKICCKISQQFRQKNLYTMKMRMIKSTEEHELYRKTARKFIHRAKGEFSDPF